MYCLYFWAIQSHDRQAEINKYLLTYLQGTGSPQTRLQSLQATQMCMWKSGESKWAAELLSNNYVTVIWMRPR